MTLLKELINIPEHVQKGDFVLRLSEGVTQAEETVRSYVVTPQLVKCFDQALAFVKSAVQENTSKATYLHGSFGSGKSHFMAVLHLLLRGDPHARGIKELAGTISKQQDWMQDKKFLLVPYHMIGAHDMESGILGGYVDCIQRMHPDAELPGVYKAEGLFQDAANLRATMGDAAFFKTLNEGGNGGNWGKMAGRWDADTYDNAVASPPGSSDRSRVISALVKKFFKSYDTQAGGRGEAFLSLDKGLSVISKHASRLGYQGLILFLDELVLWLASHAADIGFVQREGQKLAKLVEAQTPDRPIPIISFVARQRDLRELVGDSVPGSERANFSDILKHWEGRFDRVNLEDRNLPAIAERRVLRPKSEGAKIELDAAFEKSASVREAVLRVLLTKEGDRGMFRQVYPFSPALVQTLIAVSSVLQRERTALKVMMQLLVDHREDLLVGDIVPVGDLFDAVAHGQEAFSADMAVHFENAKRLYHRKLLPLLEKENNLTKEAAERLPYDDPKRVALRNDDRLVKTLLLSALVPEVESLRALTGERLAALNHGTIKSPIAGREGQEVLRRCQRWAAAVGEVRVSEEANPSITVQLTGVDTEGILRKAEAEDNPGNRVRLIRQMLFAAMEIEGEGELEQHRTITWRNTPRTCSVLFRNIRAQPLDVLANKTDEWRVVIDYPFDEGNHGPRDDLTKLDDFEASGQQAKTLCWVPSFFSEDANRDVGRLVVLEYILTGERFGDLAANLSEQDRGAARSTLENQRSQLRNAVRGYLEAAYGLTTDASVLDPDRKLELTEQFRSLSSGIEIKPPTAPNLAGALEGILGQALEQQHPAAPNFGAETKTPNLNRVHEVVTAACATPDGRTLVDPKYRSIVRGIANPLRLGELAADGTHLVLSHYWRSHFNRKAAEEGGAITVGKLSRWMNEPQSMGLPEEVRNLVIVCYAEQTNRMFRQHGGPIPANLKSLPELAELHEEQLPDEKVWAVALQRAEEVFGLTPSHLRSASNVASLEANIRAAVAERRSGCNRLYKALATALAAFGVPRETSDRFKTAEATLELAESIHNAEKGSVVTALAQASVPTSAAGVSMSLVQADTMATALEADWETFKGAMALGGDALAAWDEVKEALRHDEIAVPLVSTVNSARQTVNRILVDNAVRIAAERNKQRVDPETQKSGPNQPRTGSSQNLTPAAARELLTKLEAKTAPGSLTVDIDWRIEGQSST